MWLQRNWWWPLVVLLILLLKTWIVASMLQGEARTLAAEAAGISEDRVEIVDGLDVQLTGFDSAPERDIAVAAVEDLDSSWNVVGVLDGDGADDETAADGTTDVDEGQAEAVAAPEADEATTTDADDDADDDQAVALAPAALSAQATAEGTLTLQGAVASEDIRDDIVAAASSTFDGIVVDEIEIDSAVSGREGALRLSGEAGSSEQQATWQDTGTAITAAAGLDLVDDTSVTAVDEQLTELFALEPIEFDSGRATITGESSATLDAAAATLNANPSAGNLLIVGHTDADGATAANDALSLRRAEAVRQYLIDEGGVAAERLDAEGRGEREPKVDPEETVEDKQRNRRIEWELVDS